MILKILLKIKRIICRHKHTEIVQLYYDDVLEKGYRVCKNCGKILIAENRKYLKKEVKNGE